MRRTLFFAICLIAATPTLAQIRTPQAEQVTDDAGQQQPVEQTRPTPAGRVALSSVGQAGQRQIRQQAAEGATPMERVASRIQNRIQSRLRSRIDRNYDLQADATSPFAVAADEARRVGRPNR